MSAPSCKLLLKQMPCTLEELGQLIRECRLIVPRTLNPYGRKRAIIEYGDPEEAEKALKELLGLSTQLDKPLCVSFFGPRGGGAASNKSTQTKPGASESQKQEEIDKYVRKLYACNNECDFTQPPPPYLSYSYPPINADIVSAISQHLFKNKRFYNQVLHLMNRMNLEPPFQKRSPGFIAQSYEKEVATQTEDLPSDPESELDSDDGMEARQGKRQRLMLPETSEELRQKTFKRTRQMLQQAISHSNPSFSEKKTPAQAPTFSAPRIQLKLPESLNPKPPQTDTEKRLSVSELQELPVYKNYQVGEPSNKLYIKNLDKSVDEQQLRKLYSKYTPASQLDIKVMQQGRMKGQAFVTFLEGYRADGIARALSETNGLVWKQKPMIVCYGKQH
ncbi:hypothetical protein KR026_007253 [Drosophila bipectinata]|nr:hypothetical protein KR026_007253 [Drosophila bipectinata]